VDMASELADLTYRVLVTAANGREAQERAAIIAHWANEQSARLAARRKLRVDDQCLVEEALAALRRSSTAGRPERLAS
jgi:hypothetical protein